MQAALAQARAGATDRDAAARLRGRAAELSAEIAESKPSTSDV